jgi:hypothetical protein
MQPRVLVWPGYVMSENDGVIHCINVDGTAALCGLARGEYALGSEFIRMHIDMHDYYHVRAEVNGCSYYDSCKKLLAAVRIAGWPNPKRIDKSFKERFFANILWQK